MIDERVQRAYKKNVRGDSLTDEELMVLLAALENLERCLNVFGHPHFYLLGTDCSRRLAEIRRVINARAAEKARG